MSWDSSWDKVLRSRVWGLWPPEELVRFAAKHFSAIPHRHKVRALDLGCGAGACTWFLKKSGFQTYAVDGSLAALEQTELRLRQEGYHVGDWETCPKDQDDKLCDEQIVRLAHADFLKLPFPDGFFDLVVDVCSVQHNLWEDIKRIVVEILRVLKPGGWYFGMLVADESLGGEEGKEVEEGTRIATSGPYAGLGKVHFSKTSEFWYSFAAARLNKGWREWEAGWSEWYMRGMEKPVKHWLRGAQKAGGNQGEESGQTCQKVPGQDRELEGKA